MRVQGLVLLIAEKGFVRVKRLDLLHPVILAMVRLDEVQSGVKGSGLRVVAFILEVAAVDAVLPAQHLVAGKLQDARQIRIGHVPLPLITLLPAHQFEGVEARMVSGAAVEPVMLVVGGQVGVDACLLEYFGHRIIEGLQRPPAPV